MTDDRKTEHEDRRTIEAERASPSRHVGGTMAYEAARRRQDARESDREREERARRLDGWR